MSHVRIPPLALLGGAAAAQHLLGRRTPLTAGSLLAATPVALTSMGLMGASLLEFYRHRTTINPVDLSSVRSLVTTGPNRVTRNPMYLGMAGMLVAHACARRSVPAFLPAGAFVAAIDRGQIQAEEEALTREHGAQYRRYQRDVPRWVDRRTLSRWGRH